jgi:dienelactone hydrolase
MILALPMLLLVAGLLGMALFLLSAACFVAAGFVALDQEFFAADIPPPQRTPRLAAEAALDDSLLALGSIVAPGFVSYDPATVYREVETAIELFRDRGWLDNPATFHSPPPPLETPVVEPRRSGKLAYEHLIFDSGYEPDPASPGRDRWLGYTANHTGHAWMLRHPGPPRPWIVAIHGFGMGTPRVFFQVFQAQRLHRDLGLNVMCPVLPYHGPRRVGKAHGEGFNSGDVMDMVHAEAQAMWDIRRLLGWLRTQDAPRIGIGGVSLGGYNTALLASLEENLACAIAAVPLSNPARQNLFHSPALPLRYAEHHGLTYDKLSEVMDVISPLAMAPRVPRERRYLLGGVGDRIVPTREVHDLWLHWERPAILWYQGAHSTINLHRKTAEFVAKALRESGLVYSAGG